MRDLERRVEAGLAKVVEKSPSELGRVGYVGDLVQLVADVGLEEIVESRELDVGESLLLGQGPKCLPVGPDFFIRYAEEI